MRNLSPINENEDVVTREYVDTAVSGIASDVSDIKTAVGSDSDTESSSGTTLFAKLKYVVTSIGTLLTRITDARMTKIDSIGESSDTGTTTLFGKLNNMGSGESSTAHYVWSGEVKSFTTQYSISITNTTSSVAEKAYVKKIGSFNFSNGTAPDFFVNMATAGMVLTEATNNSTSAAVWFFISTTNYTGTNLTVLQNLQSNYVVRGNFTGGAVGNMRDEFVLINNKQIQPNTTYYLYIAVYDKLPATTGAIKMKTPIIYLQSCYKTSSTTTKNGIKRTIVGYTKLVDNSYAANAPYQTKHYFTLSEQATSFLNCTMRGNANSGDGGPYYPIIAGPLIDIGPTILGSTVTTNVYGQANSIVGNSVIIEEYY